MATCREVIQSAYRRSGVLALGMTMNELQATVGLELLVGMYQNLIVGGMFGRAEDEVYDSPSDYVAKEGHRIFNKQGATITLPDLVYDRSLGEDRQPHDGSFITIVNPDADTYTEQYIYDRSTGQWVGLHSLALGSEAPLTGRFEDHIKNMLAVRLLGELGQSVPTVLARNEGLARLALANRPDGPRTTGVGVF